MATSTTRKTVRIGVFLPVGAQLLDTACIDVFATMSYEYLEPLSFLVPSAMSELAPHVAIHYIVGGDARPGDPIELTAGMKILATHHLSDPAVQPGRLDVVLVPGPDPRIDPFPQDAVDWLAAQGACPTTDVLSVCTGIFLCGAAGLLKGRRACGPRGMQDMIRKRFEGVTLVGEKLRWVQDGNLWSSGGVTNGNDLVAAYARQSPHFPNPVANFACAIAEVGDRPQKYDKSQAAATISIVWQIFKAWMMGLGKPKRG